MNNAERLRDARIANMTDVGILEWLINDADVSTDERARFVDMRAELARWAALHGGSCLTKKQRAFAEEVARRVVPIDTREVPRGKEVETPAVLRDLPKSPPRRP
jgi:hypothetical protein